METEKGKEEAASEQKLTEIMEKAGARVKDVVVQGVYQAVGEILVTAGLQVLGGPPLKVPPTCFPAVAPLKRDQEPEQEKEQVGQAKCPHCGKKFRGLHGLEVHIGKTHKSL